MPLTFFHYLYLVNTARPILKISRDSEIRNCVVRRVDPLAGECLGAMLKVSYTRSDPWASSMNVVTASEIRDQLKDLKYLDQYLKILGRLTSCC